MRACALLVALSGGADALLAPMAGHGRRRQS